MNGLYVYALLNQQLRSATVSGHRVEVIAVGSLHAAVERVSERPPLSEEFLRTQHEIVKRLSSRADAILPARFGAFVDEGELKDLVVLREGDFTRGLAHVRGRAQMTVRLLSSHRSETREAHMPAPASGTEYLSRRRAAASAPLPAVARNLCAAVAALVADTRTESLKSALLTTIIHLVPKTKVPAYRRLVRQAARTLPRDFTLSITGPLPPFAFVPEIWP